MTCVSIRHNVQQTYIQQHHYKSRKRREPPDAFGQRFKCRHTKISRFSAPHTITAIFFDAWGEPLNVLSMAE